MAYRTFETRSSMDTVQNGESDTIRLHLNGDEQRVELPDASFVRDADISRDGADLVLTTNGGTVIVEGYFAQNNPPNLQAPDGSVLTHNLVESFARSEMRFAEAGDSKSDASPIGAVQEISGEATVTRLNGTVEVVGVGTPIYEGDIIETSEDGAVNIVFLDETTFAVSSDARLAIDEYVFDPSTQSGESNFSVLKGVFVFTSGLIGRDDPDDVHIDTPAGSIGIRGTIIAGNVDTGEITVIEGAIVLEDFKGNSITLSNQYETARFNTSGGTIEHIGDLSAGDVSNKFMSISTVAADLFSTIQDSAQDNKPQNSGNTLQNAPSETNTQGAETPAQDAPAPEDHSTLQPLGNFISSSDIANAGSEFKIFNALQSVQQSTTGTSGTITNQPLSGSLADGTSASKPILNAILDNTDRPPFTVTVTKMAFTENQAAGQTVAVIKGNFTLETKISLNGVSNNFYMTKQIDENTIEVLLKTGVSIDREHAPPLNFSATNASGAATIQNIVALDVLNVDEPTIVTNMAPNELFAASSGNSWVYDFANEFGDPDGDIAGYSYSFSGTLPGGTTTNAATGSSQLEINFGTITADNFFDITTNALDSSGNVLASTTNRMYYYLEDSVLSSVTTNVVTNNDTVTATGNSVEDLVFSSNGGLGFTAGGNDQISVSGSTNTAHGGDGNDSFQMSAGSGNVLLGEDGHDTFNINTTSNRAYGGDGSDTFVLTNAAVLSGTGTLIDGNEGLVDTLRFTNSGAINFTTINDYVKNIETLSTINAVANTITLSRSDVLAMTDDSHTLTINMDNNDTLTFINDGGGGMSFYHVGDKDGHAVFSDGVVTLLVSDTGSHTGII